MLLPITSENDSKSPPITVSKAIGFLTEKSLRSSATESIRRSKSDRIKGYLHGIGHKLKYRRSSSSATASMDDFKEDHHRGMSSQFTTSSAMQSPPPSSSAMQSPPPSSSSAAPKLKSKCNVNGNGNGTVSGQQLSALSVISGLGPWHCDRCTFVNSGSELHCEMCYFSRFEVKNLPAQWQWQADDRVSSCFHSQSLSFSQSLSL